MDEIRAEEILRSEEKIHVVWQGEPVWLDSVNARDKTATVHPEGEPGEIRTVSLKELEETK